MKAKASHKKALPEGALVADEPEDVVVPEPPLTDAEKGELAAALREWEMHLSFDPDNPASGVAGIFPPWMKTIFKLAGWDVLEFLQGKVTPDAAPVTEPVKEATPAD